MGFESRALDDSLESRNKACPEYREDKNQETRIKRQDLIASRKDNCRSFEIW